MNTCYLVQIELTRAMHLNPERLLQVGIKLPIEEGEDPSARIAEAVQKAREFVKDRFRDERYAIVNPHVIHGTKLPDNVSEEPFFVKNEEAPKYFTVNVGEVKIAVSVTEKSATERDLESVVIDLAMSALRQTRFKTLTDSAVISKAHTQDVYSLGNPIYSDESGSAAWLAK